MTEKVDFTKTLDGYRAVRGRFTVVELPEMRYLMIDGHGDPNTSPAYTHAVQALYPVAYTLKFASRRELGRDYVVPPLEGLWWADDMEAFTAARDKLQWDWTMMLMVPEWIDDAMFHAAVDVVRAKGSTEQLDDVRIDILAEGLCVQTLHLGSYDDEADVLDAMHREFVPAQGLRLSGKHHEIYLSDPRKVAPDKLRTILRQPVIRTSA
ncbi:GyrI-like domain-containing protein [Microbacterium sp. VKM Ac-2923]|uniref:GyrI-like domain-containing protein n=1 Tax=Microbacterium sp. VKM Ac-2923 TaxID=2929476 RepID=UPI001FB489CB|nr:GyrI-like domain-containing protein [Microbacterium sp. VKM Ac-2923]MCJ1706629.1 GyrI-like domain-containing protein [Microbacterium sp. VKM Ac-2923]